MGLVITGASTGLSSVRDIVVASAKVGFSVAVTPTLERASAGKPETTGVADFGTFVAKYATIGWAADERPVLACGGVLAPDSPRRDPSNGNPVIVLMLIVSLLSRLVLECRFHLIQGMPHQIGDLSRRARKRSIRKDRSESF